MFLIAEKTLKDQLDDQIQGVRAAMEEATSERFEAAEQWFQEQSSSLAQVNPIPIIITPHPKPKTQDPKPQSRRRSAKWRRPPGG